MPLRKDAIRTDEAAVFHCCTPVDPTYREPFDCYLRFLDSLLLASTD